MRDVLMSLRRGVGRILLWFIRPAIATGGPMKGQRPYVVGEAMGPWFDPHFGKPRDPLQGGYQPKGDRPEAPVGGTSVMPPRQPLRR